jgi:hypothetical protein
VADKKKAGSAFDNEGHDDSSINDVMKLSKGQLQPIGSHAPLNHQATSVNQKSGHTGGGEE